MTEEKYVTILNALAEVIAEKDLQISLKDFEIERLKKTISEMEEKANSLIEDYTAQIKAKEEAAFMAGLE